LRRKRTAPVLQKGLHDFEENGCKVSVQQLCFPRNGTDTADLTRDALGETM
jgi:hypothetical protein